MFDMHVTSVATATTKRRPSWFDRLLRRARNSGISKAGRDLTSYPELHADFISPSRVLPQN
jgi:hypothetical protein